ncbi:ribosome small subunit-dependent GTPase A [Mycoplasma marinum]|nr:ribosome small subunit-dependent GTPase A [Mycoplasma marinum]
MQGQVIRVIAGFYDIESKGVEYRTRARGNLRNEGISPVVGDIVNFEPNGFLNEVCERKNSLVRPKVANVDQAIIITSLKEPKYSSLLLDKFLAIIEFNNIKPIIVFTKADLTDETHLEEYKVQGYDAFEISNPNELGFETLRGIFKDKLSVFTGQTGAGKSTTINSLAGLNIKTQEISKALGRGKHTTRVVEIIDWFGGKLIDTPGFSSLEFNLTKLELAHSYQDFRSLSRECKFRTCIHNKEKICAVKYAAEDGKISKQRYENYLKLLEEAKNE